MDAITLTALAALAVAAPPDRPVNLSRLAEPGTTKQVLRTSGKQLQQASFDYGGVCRANTGLGEAIPPQLRLEPDQEWTVSLWMRNMHAQRTRKVACAFWGDGRFSPQDAHVFGLFAYYDASAGVHHGNLVAWVHGQPYRMDDPAMPLDDDDWHLLAVRNRQVGGSFEISLAIDGQPWTATAPAPKVSIADATLPWSLNSMYNSRFSVPWSTRSDCKLDDLVVFDWGLDDAEFATLYNDATPLLPRGKKGLYSRFEAPGRNILAHYMFGGDTGGGSTATYHRSYTDLSDTSLGFIVEGAGAGVVDATDFPGAK